MTLPELALKSGATFRLNQKPRRGGGRAAGGLSGRHGGLAAGVTPRLPTGSPREGARGSPGEPRERRAERLGGSGARGMRSRALGTTPLSRGPCCRTGSTHRPKRPALGSAPGDRTRAAPGAGDLSGPGPPCAAGEAFPRGVRRPGNVLFALRTKQRGWGGGGSGPKASSGIWCTCQRGQSGSP